MGSWQDPALDQIYPRTPSDPANEAWSIVELGEPMPEARVAPHARAVADRRSLISRLSREDDRDVAWFLAEDQVPPRPDARSGRLLSWDGAVATIEHDGTCDLVIARTFDAGWLARSTTVRNRACYLSMAASWPFGLRARAAIVSRCDIALRDSCCTRRSHWLRSPWPSVSSWRPRPLGSFADARHGFSKGPCVIPGGRALSEPDGAVARREVRPPRIVQRHLDAMG